MLNNVQPALFFLDLCSGVEFNSMMRRVIPKMPAFKFLISHKVYSL